MLPKKLWIFLFFIFLAVAAVTVYSNTQSRKTITEITKTTSSPFSLIIPPTPTPTPAYKAAPKAFSLPNARWVPQTFNNCGPATVSMVLQYFGYNVGQDVTRQALRTNPVDTNVFTYEIRDYLKNQYNIESKLLYNGDIQLLKTLIANGFYVVLENWLHPNEDIGHFIIITGYDDGRGVLIADDSYIGVNVTFPYEQFSEMQWKPFNYEYLPVYKNDMEPVVNAIVGESWDEKVMYTRAVAKNQEAVRKNPKDVYAWFNIGMSEYALGDYQKAKTAFETSQPLGWPRRMLWYQIAPVQTYNKLGEYKKALELAQLGLQNNAEFNELLLEEAIAYKGLGDISKAKEAVEQAIKYAPQYEPALQFAKTL